MMKSPQPRRNRKARQPSTSDAELIQDPSRVAEIAERLWRQSIIAFDTEFIREKTYFPQLGVIQVADREEAWIIDPLALSAQQLQPLLAVLQDPRILKAAHSVEQDQACLHYAYGVLASPLFDTAIGAALTGLGDQIGLSALLKKVLGVDLPKAHTRTDWLKRPLPAVMASYALSDVRHLVALAERLLAKLDQRGRRAWALDLSAVWCQSERFELNGETIARRLAAGTDMTPRQYAVLRSLTAWREERARKSNVPRKWLADDQVLLKLAKASPTKREELSHFRGLKIRSNGGAAGELFRAIEKGRSVPAERIPKPPQRLEPAPEEGPALSILRCFLNLAAREHKVVPRFLADSDTLLQLLRQDFRNTDELRKSGLLREGVVELVGDDIVRMLNGGLGLRLSGGRAARFLIDSDSAESGQR